MKKTVDQTDVVMSTRGRVTLPKTLRARHQWSPGTVLAVEDTPRGILLKPYLPEMTDKAAGNDRP